MRFSKRILEMDTSAVREVLALTTKPDIISFAGGLPAPESFPVEAMRMASDQVYRTNGRTALQYGPSQVEFQPVGHIYIGEKDGTVSERVQAIHDLLDGYVPCRISREIVLDIWRKYMFNAACNTVQAILRGPHLWFQRLPEACAALECVMQEIVRLANAMGIPLSESDIRALDGYFLPYPADGMCSMAQDIMAKRPTEIDLLIGEALELGRAHHVDLPVCQFVYHMVKTLEQVNAGALEEHL